MDEQEIKLRFPRASRSFIEANETPNNSQIPNGRKKQDRRKALGSVSTRADKGFQRILVRFTGFRVRPLDPDAFAGSVKHLLDCCRHSSLIPDDNPWQITLQTGQEKVAHYSEEKTLIEIDL